MSAISHEIELTEQVMAQRLELEEKKRTINMLEKALVNNLVFFQSVCSVSFSRKIKNNFR